MSRLSIYPLAAAALLIIVFGGFYWALTRPTRPQGEAIPPGALQHFAIFLQHKPCLDGCPAYAVLAKGSAGTIEYVGGKNVANTGNEKVAIDRAQLAALYRAVDQAGFFSIKDIYHNGPGGRGCKGLAPGKASVVIGVTKKARTKVIHYYYGCRGAPGRLSVLAHQIDRILDTQRWVGAAES